MAEKHTFNFRFGDVPPRQSALFESYVRVLEFRLQHKWRQLDGAVDLFICGDEIDVDTIQQMSAEFAHTVMFSKTKQAENFLSLPLKSDEIETVLNRIGQLIVKRKTNADPDRAGMHSVFRMVRWPPSEILQRSPERVRLASLMTKQASSIFELHSHSGIPIDLCRRFIEDMYAKGLLKEEAKLEYPTHSLNVQEQAIHASSQFKLFSLIRQNLSRFVNSDAHK